MTQTEYPPGPVANETLDRIRELASRLAEADKIRDELEAAIVDAYVGDAQIRSEAIAEAAGISRQRVHQIIQARHGRVPRPKKAKT